jgi:6,7-dimethyl-8-ribityllumazine synthase
MRRATSKPIRSRAGAEALSPRRAASRRVAIIRAEYNREITQSLERSCVAALVEGGIPADHIDCLTVPGCFEIPLVAKRLARTKGYAVIIALGAVIRGETHHFDLVASECARGIMQVSLDEDVPIIFEVLATYNRRDALRRAGNDKFNKGLEAAESALLLLATLDHVKD